MNERHAVLPHEFVDVCDVGKGKLKALLKTASGLKGKALDEELKSLLDGITKETEKAPSLAKQKRIKWIAGSNCNHQLNLWAGITPAAILMISDMTRARVAFEDCFKLFLP